mgnify:FL=1
MTVIPPDTLPPAELDRLLAGCPKETERELDMLHLEWLAWLVVTGRLQGDTGHPVADDIEYPVVDPTVTRPVERGGPGYSGC